MLFIKIDIGEKMWYNINVLIISCERMIRYA